jgi:ribosomal protein L16 Arg81 hydroxylase
MAISAQESYSCVSRLDDILSPMSRRDFIEGYFGKSFLHLPGLRGKFSSLLRWSELNRILEDHRLAPPRLRLFQAGKEINPERYIHLPRSSESRIRAADFTNLLGQGATLVIDEFDELHRPVRELALELERIFRIHIQANLYGGWRTAQGFLLHYDNHDTLIFQITGRKHWQVYRPTRLYPLEQGKDSEAAEKPIGEPLWDDMVEDGGLLYIPRGWWHVAYPVDEPTLHLTVGLANHRGLDVLLWLVDCLKSYPEARQDIPHLSSASEQQGYLKKLLEHFLNTWTVDLIDRYMAASDSTALTRPYLQLPHAATPEGIVIHHGSRIRLVGPRRLNLSGNAANGGLEFKCSARTLHCSVAVVPALEKLNDGQSHDVRELIALTRNQDTTLINFLQVLALQGVVTTASDTETTLELGFERTR